MHSQCGKENLVGKILGDGRLRNDIHVARHARVDDEIFTGVAADHFDHRRDVGVDEIEHHRILCRGGWELRGKQCDEKRDTESNGFHSALEA